MHWLVWLFIGVLFGVSYRVGYKVVSGIYPPLFSIGVICLVACAVTLTAYFLLEKERPALKSISFNPRLALLLLMAGVFTAGLEVANMMMYHTGGLLSIAQVLASSITSLIVFMIGLSFFREKLNAGQIMGFFLGLAGAALMTYASWS